MGKILNVTMSDVGREAGVSQTTVSLALRNDASIPIETRARIRAAARRLNYRPHAGVSSLMAQIRSRRPIKFRATLAAVTSWTDPAGFRKFPTWRDQWDGARSRAKALGYVLEEFRMGRDGLNSRRLKSILDARNIEGVVVFPLSGDEPPELPWERLAAVTIGYTLEHPILNRFATAHFDSVLIALEQLHARGYRRIGLVLDEQLKQRVHRSWLAAFCVFGFESGEIAVKAIARLPAAGSQQKLARWVRDFRPDAIICGSLFPVRSWLREIHLRSPEDIGFVMLANLPTNEGCAHIDECWKQVGQAAIDGVVGQLYRGERGIPSRPVVTLVRGEWVDGNSVRKPTKRSASGR